ncbi:MAG: hypothetical protein IPH93_16485 [Saprospiraceae bacterium]|nr:hypothetical protein [Saprospiraceae bacterium]
MAKSAPFHSVRETDKQVYHNNSSCTEGNNIEPQYRRSGTDNRPLCKSCEKIN